MESRNTRHHTAADLAEATNTVLGIERNVPPPEKIEILNANLMMVCRTSGGLYRLDSTQPDIQGQYRLKSLDYGTTRMVSQADLEDDYRVIGNTRRYKKSQ